MATLKELLEAGLEGQVIAKLETRSNKMLISNYLRWSGAEEEADRDNRNNDSKTYYELQELASVVIKKRLVEKGLIASVEGITSNEHTEKYEELIKEVGCTSCALWIVGDGEWC